MSIEETPPPTAEAMDKHREEEKARLIKEKGSPFTYRQKYSGQCGGCNGFNVRGEVICATGEKLPHGYEPHPGEILKFIWLECGDCDWNQYG